MPTADFVRDRIVETLPGSTVDVLDTTGGGDHFQAHVIWSGFEGMNRVQQHQAVYAAVQPQLSDGSIHALSIRTAIPQNA
jgi:acid stress-induced BolA-like protein IbaG/YrbA